MTCGTVAGYQRHRRAGEDCDDCRQANAAYQREWRARNPDYLRVWRKRRGNLKWLLQEWRAGNSRNGEVSVTARGLILDLLELAGRSLTADELVARLEPFGKNYESVTRALARMRERGEVKALLVNGEWRWRSC